MLPHLPGEPGVYLMRDADGTVAGVGLWEMSLSRCDESDSDHAAKWETSNMMFFYPDRVDLARDDAIVYSGETSTSQIHRRLEQLAEYLGRYYDFPYGAVLLTGTCIVPGDDFTLSDGDEVVIEIEQIGTLRNPVKQM